MGLSPRQEILFTSVVDLFEPVMEVQGKLDSDPGKAKKRYRIKHRDVRCFWRQSVSQTVPLQVGTLEAAGHHTFSFAEDQEIQDDWYIIDRTPGTTENHSWQVVSKPQRIQKRGDRDAGQVIVQAILVDTPHQDIPSS
jgi:hypothetical protein